ncbi:hypothetical protein QBC39DRAFT_134163 [Podospora conica]|nr:hypothetical protein QBC39DRAFT_134163 [Schizothecium conicum]
MEKHTNGDGAPELEQKSRREDMMDGVEELKSEVGDGSGLGDVQQDVAEPPKEMSPSEEPEGETRRSEEPDDTSLTSRDEEPRVEDSSSDEPEKDNKEEEAQEEKPTGGEPERKDPKDDQAHATEEKDDEPPQDDHSTSGTDITSESRQSTAESQQSTLADSDEDRRRLEHCAPEVVEEPPDQEKKLDQFASPDDTFANTTDDVPSHCRQHRHNGLFWSPPSPLLEPVPPKYPGDPTTYPEVVEAPMELEASVERTQELICGLRKRQFLLMFGIVSLIVVVVAVSVGVGVAYGTRKTSAAPASAPTPWPLKPCDAIHNTKFTTENGKVFQRLCFLDYGGSHAEATDLTSAKTSSMEDCMKACSEVDECTGAGWGPANGVNAYRTMCWMKKNLKKPHAATADFEFAVLVSGNVTIPDMEPYF